MSGWVGSRLCIWVACLSDRAGEAWVVFRYSWSGLVQSLRQSKQPVSLAGYLDNTGESGQRGPLNSHYRGEGKHHSAVLGNYSGKCHFRCHLSTVITQVFFIT